ncbi:hypothetical protein KY363_06255 [Candidatus Woesearchaeota archaeon]|nr:hypothetical protein [Candidatus Woesearchaeota archaeon]
MVLGEVAYFDILGYPLIMYLGILTFLSLIFTASISVMNRKGINRIPMRWHFIMARITIALAAVHGILAFLSYI